MVEGAAFLLISGLAGVSCGHAGWPRSAPALPLSLPPFSALLPGSRSGPRPSAGAFPCSSGRPAVAWASTCRRSLGEQVLFWDSAQASGPGPLAACDLRGCPQSRKDMRPKQATLGTQSRKAFPTLPLPRKIASCE